MCDTAKDMELLQVAEESLVQSNFHEALRSASQVLSSSIHTYDTTIATTKQCGHFLIQHFPIIIDDETKAWGHIPMILQLSTLQGSNRHSVHDRAAAIVIQSSYELWKDRHETSNNDASSSKNDEKKDLYANLQPFFKVYTCVHDSDGISSMPLDLASMWIHFCNAIGLHDQSITFIIESLNGMIHHNGHDIKGSDDILYDQCYELLQLLFIKILPYVSDIHDVETIIERFFHVVVHDRVYNGSSEDINSCAMTEPTRLESHPTVTSVDAIRCKLDTYLHHNESDDSTIGGECTTGILASFFGDALDECWEDIDSMYHSTVKTMSRKKQASHKQQQSSVSSLLPTRTVNERLDRHCQEDGHSEEDEDANVASSVKDYLIHELWMSEERWLNRGKVIAGGFMIYTTWRRREKFLRTAKSAQQALLSPIREVLDAVALSSHQKMR